jgi:hypothetical protein
MERVAGLPCLVTGRYPVQLHHVTATISGGRIARSHKRVVPLVPEMHQIQHGPRESVEALGHRGFYERWGIDLLFEANRLWLETEAMKAPLRDGDAS